MKYEIKFHSYWHCGSGQAAGADVDELVIKDEYQLPYVPGRTIKGLLRDALESIGEDTDTIERIFGKGVEADRNSEDKQFGVKGAAHFSNAEISTKERDFLVSSESGESDLRPFLYRSIASTAIDNQGIAKEHSLRKIEVTIPCTLYGTIDGVNTDDEKKLEKAMMYTKRLGLGRNRGLGRCTIKREEE